MLPGAPNCPPLLEPLDITPAVPDPPGGAGGEGGVPLEDPFWTLAGGDAVTPPSTSSAASAARQTAIPKFACGSCGFCLNACWKRLKAFCSVCVSADC